MTCENSSAVTYKVFREVSVTYFDMHMASRLENPGVIEIDYCHEGCMECEVGNQVMVLGAGDVLIHRKSGSVCRTSSSQNHFHGISITIDRDVCDHTFEVMLNDLAVDLSLIGEKYCGGEGMSLIRGNSTLVQIFSALYSIPEDFRIAFAKAKIPELMFFLNTYANEPGSDHVRRSFSSYAVSQTKAAAEYLASHTDRQTGVAQLAAAFGLSQTVLKNCFRQMYGDSIASYSRRLRMEKAALLLASTDMNIMDVASQVGYSNASKFAGVFRTVMGVPPHEYRARIDQTGLNSDGME